MRRLKQTFLFSSVLALGCSGGVEPMPMGGDMADTTGTPSAPQTPGVGTPGSTLGGTSAPSSAASGGASTGVSAPTASGVVDPPPPRNETVCEQGIPPTSQVPRLTNAQYNRTVYDLLHVNAPGYLATEQTGNITKAIWDGYVFSAETIAETVMAAPALKANFLECTPAPGDNTCLLNTVRDFGRRAYRRPLAPEEIAKYQELIIDKAAQVTETGSPDEVAELILSTMLKAPSFLQRAELAETADSADGRFKLSSHEVAARLSYMLWGTMPDTELDAAADADALQTKEQVLEQALRMVRDPKANDVAAEFHREYIHLTATGRWTATQKDPALFPNFKPEVVPDMINETERLFDSVFSGGGSFQDLLTTPKAYVTKNTAALYGLNPADFGTDATEVDLADRPGFLTRVGFLAAFGNQNRNNPIVRGAFITKDVMGVDPGAPDPAAAQTPLPSDPNLKTLRQKVEAMTANSPCSNCHQPYVNPPGFVMEAFDSSGAVQTVEHDTRAPIDSSAQVRFAFGEEPVLIANPTELVTKIAQSPAAQRYYAQKWVAYAYGRSLTKPDVCTVDAMAQKLTASGYSIQNLLTDLTQTDLFLTRAVEVTQ